MKYFIISLRMLLVMTVLTGIIYPLFITLIGQAVFYEKANGSLLKDNNELIGSSLIGQNFTLDKYFWLRPSAGNYGTVPSGASNLGPTSSVKLENYNKQKMLFGNALSIPDELLFTSGSGLDPHITPEGAVIQIDRVAKARNFNQENINKLYQLKIKFTEGRDFFIMGEKRVNVLKLNIALDKME